MGIDPATLLIASTVLSIGSGVMQYSQQKSADKAARNAANEQARLMQEDADRAALQEKIDADKTRKVQKMAYLSSGVDLEGSPLLVMEETRNQGDQNAKNIRDSGYARADITRKQGSVGRASLVGTIADAASTATSNYISYQQINGKQIK